MAKINHQTQLDLKLVFTISEAEARAIDALVGYGDDAFIKAFYEKLGAAYMRDHEEGLRTFFRDISTQLPSILEKFNQAKNIFDK